jgi:NAD(P)-dependent dehydrogenase (short-subunit alcohol dehydrogenase family)
MITGAGRGIGFAIAQRIAEAGAHVLIIDRDQQAAEAAAEQLRGTDRTVRAQQLDVSDPRAVDRVVTSAAANGNGIDILVNSAGIYPPTPLADFDLDTWQRVFDINVTAALLTARAVAPHMQASGRGVIVNITSTAAVRPQSPGLAAYVGSKHALEGLTKSLALELGPAGIRVLAVAPSVVITPGMEQQFGDGDDASVNAVLDHLAAATPLRRIMSADEVARAVLFAVSDLASFITGSTILVDGGAMTL